MTRENTDNYLSGLNTEQRLAVENYKGASLVIAGAGSGKTRVLTYRIAYAISQGESPNSILALTFTNKASGEIKDRIAKILNIPSVYSYWMGTFHSIFARILRQESESHKYSKDFTIYDQTDAKNVMKLIIKNKNLDDKIYDFRKIMNRISMLKNNLITPSLYPQQAKLVEQDRHAHRPAFHELYKQYQNNLLQSDAMDFDDILLNTNFLFRNNPLVLEKYQQIFKFILIDEYQDTNLAQYMIIKQLASKRQNICVVGDDAQSIYAFRGADISNIYSFQQDFKNVKVYKLEQNYRSTQNILDAANSVIKNNKSQIKKDIWSNKAKGDKIQILKTTTDNDEAFQVANKINKLKKNYNSKYSDTAILYRTNAQSRIFEQVFKKINIPYKIIGGHAFYQRKEIKDILAYLRLIVNKNDNEAFRRIINYPARKIGQTTINKIEEIAKENDTNLWFSIINIQKYKSQFNNPTILRILNFVKLINFFTEQINEKDAFELSTIIVEKLGIIQLYKNSKNIEDLSRLQNIEELLNSIKDYIEDNDDDFISISNYMSSVSLLTESDKKDEDDKNKVLLMTVHSAKGLEFKNIFIVGAEENLFPSSMTSNSEKGLEEERRLFYVASTRAQVRLFISYTQQRLKWGNIMPSTISRFVEEIDEKFTEENDYTSSQQKHRFGNNNNIIQYTRKNYKKEGSDNYGYKNEPAIQIPQPQVNQKFKRISNNEKTKVKELNYSKQFDVKVGDKIKHKIFGVGQILSLEEEYPNTKAKIKFENAKEKQLLLKFAKITKI